MIWQDLWQKWCEPKAFNEGYLPKADGHEVYFAEYGNPNGMPLLTTHGGPGGAVNPQRARWFDLKKYRVIMFDQRGCGKSLPFGELRHNTTENILFDMRRLLEYLQIEGKVVLHGGSWASTLMLLFAERNADRVQKMVLSQIFLADERNAKWMDEQCALFYPDIMAKLCKPLSSWQRPAEYYLKLLNADEVEKQKQALSLWGNFERQVGSLRPCLREVEEVDPVDLAYARIYTQYAAASFGLKSNEIMRNIKKIKNIPMVLIHNRLDMLCPLQGAYELAKNTNQSRLVIVPAKGHVGKLLSQTIRAEIKKFL